MTLCNQMMKKNVQNQFCCKGVSIFGAENYVGLKGYAPPPKLMLNGFYVQFLHSNDAITVRKRKGKKSNFYFYF